MKKIILILFLFFICYACYFIYNITEDDSLLITSIGDNIALGPYVIKNGQINDYNTDFVNTDYRIKDILNILTYNVELNNNDNISSIHQILKKSDILILSIGMNDIYSKLNDNTKEIYTYLNNIINDYELVLKKISKYDYKKVYILGYYNITNKNTDIYAYINYKLKSITNEYNYTYLDLNSIFYNNPKYLEKTNNYYLNSEGIKQINKLIVENL